MEDPPSIEKSGSQNNEFSQAIRAEEEGYAQKKLTEARQIIAECLPEALPSAPIKLVIKNYRASGTYAEYLGHLRGTHYISLSPQLGEPKGNLATLDEDITKPTPDNNPYSKQEVGWNLKNLIAIIHELIHQKHQELTGLSSFYGENNIIDKLISDQQISEYGPLKILEEPYQYIKEKGPLDFGFIYNSLAPVVVEGIAVLGEIYIVRRMVIKARRAGNTEEYQILTKELRERLHSLKEIRDQYKTEHRYVEGGQYYEGAFRLANVLYKIYGLAKLPEILSKVNIHACNQIIFGSELYNQILSNPQLLPGLEGSG